MVEVVEEKAHHTERENDTPEEVQLEAKPPERRHRREERVRQQRRLGRWRRHCRQYDGSRGVCARAAAMVYSE